MGKRKIVYAGKTWYGCECLAEWLPVVTKLAIKRGIIKKSFDISQMSYSTGVKASAGTHSGGGVFDCVQYGASAIRLMRECGAFASDRLPSEGRWPRHNHVVLVDCPHLAGSAERQVSSYKRGRNGLKNQAKDRGPRVSPIRTWKQGVAWANQQLNPSAPKPAPSPNIDQLARDVIAGRYGTGAERKRRLGSRYDAVQARVNQLLKGGSKPAPKPKVVPPFPSGLKPNSSRPSARALQAQLKRAGFMPRSVPAADNYGPQTQKAVAAFHNKHRQFRSKGKSYDPAIGPSGWKFLFTNY